MKLTAKRCLLAAAAACLGVAWWAAAGGGGAVLAVELVSASPFPVEVTTVFPGDDVPETRTLAPGEAITVTGMIGAGDEHVFDVAVFATGTVVSSLYGGSVVFDGDFAHTVHGETLPFRRYAADDDDSRVIVTAPAPGDVSTALVDDRDVDEARRQARELAEVLPRRLQFIEEWRGRAAPVLPLAVFTDPNGAFSRGTMVVSADGITPLGGRVDLRPGDHLEAINGRPVYADVDVFEALWRHINESSAGEPYRVRLIRNGRVYETRSAAYYNDAAFATSDDESVETGLRAFARALTLASGMDINALCAAGANPDQRFPSASCRVQQRNRQLLLAAQHPMADTVGSVMGVPIPIFRWPLARVLRGIPGGRATATIAGEAGQLSVWAANDVPANGDRLGSAAQALPWGAGAGVLIAAAGAR